MEDGQWQTQFVGNQTTRVMEGLMVWALGRKSVSAMVNNRKVNMSALLLLPFGASTL